MCLHPTSPRSHSLNQPLQEFMLSYCFTTNILQFRFSCDRPKADKAPVPVCNDAASGSIPASEPKAEETVASPLPSALTSNSQIETVAPDHFAAARAFLAVAKKTGVHLKTSIPV